MKFIDKLILTLLNFLLLLLSATIPSLVIASSPAFYKTQFIKTGIYATIDENGILGTPPPRLNISAEIADKEPISATSKWTKLSSILSIICSRKRIVLRW